MSISSKKPERCLHIGKNVFIGEMFELIGADVGEIEPALPSHSTYNHPITNLLSISLLCIALHVYCSSVAEAFDI